MTLICQPLPFNLLFQKMAGPGAEGSRRLLPADRQHRVTLEADGAYVLWAELPAASFPLDFVLEKTGGSSFGGTEALRWTCQPGLPLASRRVRRLSGPHSGFLENVALEPGDRVVIPAAGAAAPLSPLSDPLDGLDHDIFLDSWPFPPSDKD